MTVRDRFVALDLAAIDGFLRNGEEEGLHLEFKIARTEDLRHRDDRKNLARAISGFANSDGGVIVWGVDCRQDANGIDRVNSLPGVANFDLLCSRLKDLTPEAASPPVEGVEHKRILRGGGAGGFVATLVPESESGPHMAKLGEDRYMFRSADSFRRMEHFQIADMFGRRPQPKLELAFETEFEDNAQRLGEKLLIIHVKVRNAGRGVAAAPFIALTPPECFGGEREFHEIVYDPLKLVISDWPISYAGLANDVIQPGTTIRVCSLRENSESPRPCPVDNPVDIGTFVSAIGHPPLEAVHTVCPAATTQN